MADWREWLEEKRTEGIGAAASLLLVAGAVGGLGYMLLRGTGMLGGEDIRVTPPGARAEPGAVAIVDEQGRRRTLADFRGKVVLVDVWATWCPPCRQSLPGLAAMQAEALKHGEASPLVVVPISVDEGGLATVRRYLSENPGLQLVSYAPAEGSKSLAPLGSIRGIPASFVLDRQGRIRQRWAGYIPGFAEQAVKDALDEK
jgi:thiol-disulfide isomerase/thioredoxin